MRKTSVGLAGGFAAAALILGPGAGMALADGVPAPNVVGDYAGGGGGGSAPAVPDTSSGGGGGQSAPSAPAVPEAPAVPDTSGGGDSTGGGGGYTPPVTPEQTVPQYTPPATPEYTPEYTPEQVAPQTNTPSSPAVPPAPEVVTPSPSGPSAKDLDKQRDGAVQKKRQLAWTGYDGTDISALADINKASDVSLVSGSLALVTMMTLAGVAYRRSTRETGVEPIVSIPAITAPAPTLRLEQAGQNSSGGRHRKEG